VTSNIILERRRPRLRPLRISPRRSKNRSAVFHRQFCNPAGSGDLHSLPFPPIRPALRAPVDKRHPSGYCHSRALRI